MSRGKNAQLTCVDCAYYRTEGWTDVPSQTGKTLHQCRNGLSVRYKACRYKMEARG